MNARDRLAKAIGARLRRARKEAGLTQAQLADGHVTKSFVSQVEKGQSLPSLATLSLFSIRLRKPISWFFRETEETDGTSALNCPQCGHEMLVPPGGKEYQRIESP